MGDVVQLPGTGIEQNAASEDEVVNTGDLVARLDALLDRWERVGDELRRRGVLRTLDHDLQFEIGELLREGRP